MTTPKKRGAAPKKRAPRVVKLTPVLSQHCIEHGHIWLETDGTPYSRHRGRSQVDVTVTCKYCKTTASLPAFAANTAPPRPSDLGSVPKH